MIWPSAAAGLSDLACQSVDVSVCNSHGISCMLSLRLQGYVVEGIQWVGSRGGSAAYHACLGR